MATRHLLHRTWPWLMVLTWYGFVYLVIRPLTDAPVVDSWVYEHAVRWFELTGRFQFPGFTRAMPISQVLYGAAWGRLFGSSSKSLDLSVAALGLTGALLFYALVRRCGAELWSALLATALLVCNPCYLFLSFSFMTDVPFLVALLGSHLAFAQANAKGGLGWLWLSAMLALMAFTVRPLAGAAILGSAAALLMYPANVRRGATRPLLDGLKVVAPFAIALLLCAAFWIWLMVLHPQPWKFAEEEYRLHSYFMLVPLRNYIEGWLLWPATYLGLVLSPLALLQAARRWRLSVVLGLVLFSVSAIVMRVNNGSSWTVPAFKCFGGGAGALVLRGMPNRPANASGAAAAAVGSLGLAGLCIAAIDTFPRLNRAAAAVLLTAALYWAATLPLWFFSDRYYLAMVPAGCLLLALAPCLRGRVAAVASLAMTAVLGLGSLGGVYAYHRGMQAVVHERDELLREGIPRASIDAGYSLNGMELYRYPAQGMDTEAFEAGIPMITASDITPYMIAGAVVPGTEVVRCFSWPGPFGFGSRPLYVLRRLTSSDTGHRSAIKQGQRK